MNNRRVVIDFPLVLAALLLSAYGIAVVYSAGQTDVPTVAAHAYKFQIGWLVLACVTAFVVSRASVRFLEWLTTPAYVLTCALLALTLVFGSGA